MALIKCSECSKDISEYAPVCPHCGSPNKKHHQREYYFPKERSVWKWVVGIPVASLILFFGYGLVASRSPEAQEKFRAREHIEFCWKDQARKSFDPATARFVAGVCEKLESEFSAKYGHKP